MAAWLCIYYFSYWTKEEEIKRCLSSFKIIKIFVICLYLELGELIYKWSQIDLSKHPEVVLFSVKDSVWRGYPACYVCSNSTVIFLGFTNALGYITMSSALSSLQTVCHRLSWSTVTSFPSNNSRKSST